MTETKSTVHSHSPWKAHAFQRTETETEATQLIFYSNRPCPWCKGV